MRCKNCGADISENEIFCDECKVKLKQVSSREELRELKELIEEQHRFNELDDTKELVSLEDLPDPDTTDTVEEIKEETMEEKVGTLVNNNEEFMPQKNDKKKIIIIVSIVALVLLILIISIILLFNRSDDKEKIEIDYLSVINEYGDIVKKSVEDYIKEKSETPAFEDIQKSVNYNKHEVICMVHEIYADGNIYLSSCKVDDKDTNYSYGKKQDEEKTGQVLKIYKSSSNDSVYYNVNGGDEVGTVTCKTDKCTHYASYETYSIVKEDGKFYIYNYKLDSLVFGPFDLEDEITLGNTLYAVMYTDDGIRNMYSLVVNKEFKNINGSIVNSNNENVMLKYGYIVLNNNNKYNFVNLKTGNISYSISCTSIGEIVEDKKNSLAYIKANTSNDKFQVYNSNGKLLFDGTEYNKFNLYDDRIVVSNDSNYRVYDLKVNLKSSSTILSKQSNFIALLNNNNLQLVDNSDKVLVTFDDEWSNDYKYKADLSGSKTYDDKSGLYIVVENSSISEGESGHFRLYYYNESTKETGVIEKATLN